MVNLKNLDQEWDDIPIVRYKGEPQRIQDEKPLRERHYKDFSSIDWAFEYEKSRNWKKALQRETFSLSFVFKQLQNNSRWVILIGTGLLIGFFASSVDYLYRWLTDLKGGVCSNGIYMTHSSCCKGLDEGATCSNWKQWGEIIHLSPNNAGSFIYQYFLYLVTSFILALLAGILVSGVKYVKTSGVSEVKTIISGVIIEDFLSLKTMIIKLIGLTLIVSSGMWAGKEGPLVHISCSCASLLMKWFPQWNNNEAKKRELLVAASVAGISVAFNAPISGVLFSLEQLTSYFYPSDKMWTSFVCAMAGVVVLGLFNEGIDIYVTMENQWLSVELFGFILLGILGGLYGTLFNRLNLWFANLRRRYIVTRGSKYEVLEVLVLSVITSVVTYPLVFPRLPLTTMIGRLYKDCGIKDPNIIGGLCDSSPTSSLVLLFFTGVVGIFLTAYTFGTIVPAGILMPSLAIGAIFGRFLGISVEQISKANPYLSSICDSSSKLCISPGAYAVVGSAAFLAGVTKMTVWVVVTVFELTGALAYALPIMISVLIAKVTSDKFDEYNCYDRWIHFFGYPYLNPSNKIIPPIKSRRVYKEIESLEAIYFEDLLNITQLENFIKLPYQGLPVLLSRQTPHLEGWVSLTDLGEHISHLQSTTTIDDKSKFSFDSRNGADLNLSVLVDKSYLVLKPDLELPTLVDIFFKLKAGFVLFCENGYLKGIITLNDMTRLLLLTTDELLDLDYENLN